MLTREQLEKALAGFPAEVVQIDVVDAPRFVVTVISRSFEGQDEGERQVRIWKHLRERLPEDDLPRIEFVFTDTPAERAAS